VSFFGRLGAGLDARGTLLLKLSDLRTKKEMARGERELCSIKGKHAAFSADQKRGRLRHMI